MDAEIRRGVIEWLRETWQVGVVVGGALGAAQAAGRHIEVRASLGVLATATTVVLVLGADVFTDSVRLGLAARERLRLASLGALPCAAACLTPRQPAAQSRRRRAHRRRARDPCEPRSSWLHPKHPLQRSDSLEQRARRSRLAVLASQALEPQEYLSAFSRGDQPPHDCISEIRHLLSEYTAGFSGPVVVWIDELDRCPPEYALGVLAAARSVCALEHTVCVLVINPEPLKRAVELAVRRRLGGDATAEDVDVYLRRFIDARFDLVTPGEDSFERGENRASFLGGVLRYSGCSGTFAQAGYASGTLWEIAKSSRLSLRDVEQIVYRVAAVWSRYPDRPADGYEKAKQSGTYCSAPGLAYREATAWRQTMNRALALAVLRTLAPNKFAEYRRGFIYPDDSEHPVPLAQELFHLCRPDTSKDDPPLPGLKDLMAHLADHDMLHFEDLGGLVRAVEVA